MLGQRIIHGDHRKRQLSVGLHRPQADHTRRGLLRAANNLQYQLPPLTQHRIHQVRTIVHRHLRGTVQHLMNVPIVTGSILTPDGICSNTIYLIERRRHIILSRQRIRGTQSHLGPTRSQRAHQVRRLRGHMQTRRHTQPGQRPLRLPAFPNRGQHRHPRISPYNAPLALSSQRSVLTVTAHTLSLLSHHSPTEISPPGVHLVKAPSMGSRGDYTTFPRRTVINDPLRAQQPSRSGTTTRPPLQGNTRRAFGNGTASLKPLGRTVLPSRSSRLQSSSVPRAA
jgi:hypothetical protein